ncbi:MAG: polyisoprenoid-binding protein [Parvularculaceae bacterium]|nr:polyisoprenoid-binding protein [Parvularculaceae bacterium]
MFERLRLAVVTLAGAAAVVGSCAREPAAEAAPATPAKDAAPTPTPVATDAPAGEYRLDKSHASLIFKVDHIGYSAYKGSFDDFDATLAFDPKAPETMRVTATISVASLDIPTPPQGFLDELKGPAWLNAAAFPAMTFRSTGVALTGPAAARVDGELEFRGIRAPVAFDTTFNGGYAGFPPYDPNARIGFSAKGSLKRSVFGLLIGIPTPEAPVGVGDDVAFEIEAEFSGPPAPKTPPPAQQ